MVGVRVRWAHTARRRKQLVSEEAARFPSRSTPASPAALCLAHATRPPAMASFPSLASRGGQASASRPSWGPGPAAPRPSVAASRLPPRPLLRRGDLGVASVIPMLAGGRRAPPDLASFLLKERIVYLVREMEGEARRGGAMRSPLPSRPRTLSLLLSSRAHRPSPPSPSFPGHVPRPLRHGAAGGGDAVAAVHAADEGKRRDEENSVVDLSSSPLSFSRPAFSPFSPSTCTSTQRASPSLAASWGTRWRPWPSTTRCATSSRR